MTDSDPCAGCPHLVARDGYAPDCARNAHYGQAFCARKSRPIEAGRRGAAMPQRQSKRRPARG